MGEFLKPSVILRNALSLFGPNGEHWAHGPGDRKTCWCAGEAIIESSGGERIVSAVRDEALGYISEVISPKWVMLMDWNDHPQRKFPSIRRAFRRAIRLAEKEERAQEESRAEIL
jgi:hypothetical protein